MSTRSSSRKPDAPATLKADRRQRRSTEIREKLFRAALKLFGEKGFADTTFEDIHNAADVAKATFFNYIPSKEPILIAFSEMQLAKLQATVESFRHTVVPMTDFFREMSLRMTAEPGRAPDVVRAILQANLSSSSVRRVMQETHQRAHRLLTQLVQAGQERGEFRRDLSASELAHVFRQTVFGTLLLWSVYGDATLPERINTAINVLWTGLAPREATGIGGEAPA